jgi:hypothetical protein
MSLQWFDNPEFRNVCIQNKLEAAINGDGRLILICPKYPGKEVEEKLTGLIPKEQQWAIVEGISMGLCATIKVMLMMFGVRDVTFKNLPGHHIVIEIENPPKATATQPGSPLWDQLAQGLQQDAFIANGGSYQIRVNGEVYRDSDGYVKPDDLPTSPEDMEDDGDHRPLSEQAKENMSEFQQAQRRAQRNTPPPKPAVKDDRFDYDREFLPKDVATDVKILLETCGSVEEFLKNI